MIQWMHQLSRHWLATFLMAGLALSFVVWGIADIFTGNTSTAVAQVGSTEIDQRVFLRSYKNFVSNESRRSGQEISPDAAKRMGLPAALLQQMVGSAALDNVAVRLGLTTSDASTAQTIQSIPGFRGVSGFDRSTFLRLIGQSGYGEQEFFEQMRKDITRQQLTASAEGNFLIPPGYAQALFLFLNERRAADYVIVSPDSIGAIPPPDDAALAATVKANPARFSTPEYRDADYAEIAPEDLASQIAVTDAMIAQEYAARKATYVIPEKRDIEQIEYASQADAAAAKAKIDAGTPFQTVALGKGVKPAELSLGTLSKADMADPTRADAAFALAVGQVSVPVKSAFGGYVLMRTTKITPGSSRSLDEVKDELHKNIATALAGNKITDIVNAFQDARSAGASVAEAAKKTGMKYGHVAAIDPNGKTPDGSPAAAPQDVEFLAQMFKAEVGEDSDPFATKSGTYYAVKVNGVTPPKLKTLDQVRAEAIAAWTSERRAQLLATKAALLAAQAAKDNALDAVARDLKVTVQHSPALARTTNDTMFSASLMQKLFAAKPGGVVSGTQGLSGNFIIARVTGIAHPQILPGSPGFAQGMQELSQNMAGDISVALANAARAGEGVKINQKLLDSAVGEGS
jgi:peptidyl-prolyl cis-trans isomerase D